MKKIFKFRREISYVRAVEIEAETLEEAQQRLENEENDLDWYDDEGGEYLVINETWEVGLNEDGDYATSQDEVDTWEESSDDIVIIDNEDGDDPFFDVSDNDFKNLVGKCFANYDNTIVLKVTGLRDDYDSPYYEDDYHISNFLYEQFEKDFMGEWCEEDYNWLQDTAKDKPEYKRWCLSKYTNMNIASEDMYHLAIDGNLYVWVDCDEYSRFHEISQEEFEKIKQSVNS